ILSERVQPDLKLAAALFDSLERATRNKPGIVRDSYGAGEQAAHDIMRAAAESMGLEASIGGIGNLVMSATARGRVARRIRMGSRLDSVPHGGNSDGAAGVVPALSVVASLRQAGIQIGC